MQSLFIDFPERNRVYLLMYSFQCRFRKLIGFLYNHIVNCTHNCFMLISTTRIPNCIYQLHRELLVHAHEPQNLMASPDDFDMQRITKKMVDDLICNDPLSEFFRVDFTIVELVIAAEIRVALQRWHIVIIVSLVIVDILIMLDFSDNLRNII